MTTPDLVVRGGLVVDGTGAPGHVADVAVVDERIVAVGEVDGRGAREIDASGRVVCPGFVDVHTHLDAQLFWDPMGSVSSWHGVSTVITGNCGFGIAPTRARDRELAVRTLETVEGMDAESLFCGLGDDWGFETFPEFFDALDRSGTALNVGALVPHSSLRLYALGEEAARRSATADEVEQMAALLHEGLRAGAVGFSTSMAPSHTGFHGLPVPSRLAGDEEVDRLCQVLADEGRGVLMPAIGRGLGIGRLGDLARRYHIPITFAAVMVGQGGPGGHRRILERVEQLQGEGLEIVPQIACEPLTMEFSMNEPYPIAVSMPGATAIPTLETLFQPVFSSASGGARLAVYRDNGFRNAFRAATSVPEWTEKLWPHVYVSDVPGRPDLAQRRLVDVARESGDEPSDAMLDLTISSGLAARFTTAVLNMDEDEVEKLVLHPGTQLGLSDAGAHMSQLCDAAFPTHLLGHWVRDKQALSLEEAVHLLTSRSARLYRLRDRGQVKTGFAADLVIFDPKTVGHGRRYTSRDLPAGAARVVIDAVGIDHVIVNGQVIRSHGEDTVNGSRPPGRVLRHADLAW
jgi:N-acyl-D-aspartate/D-glutamate deacylase